MIGVETVPNIKSKGEKEVIFKFDFENVYDRVDMNFADEDHGKEGLWEIMEKLD